MATTQATAPTQQAQNDRVGRNLAAQLSALSRVNIRDIVRTKRNPNGILDHDSAFTMLKKAASSEKGRKEVAAELVELGGNPVDDIASLLAPPVQARKDYGSIVAKAERAATEAMENFDSPDVFQADYVGVSVDGRTGVGRYLNGDDFTSDLATVETNKESPLYGLYNVQAGDSLGENIIFAHTFASVLSDNGTPAQVVVMNPRPIGEETEDETEEETEEA